MTIYSASRIKLYTQCRAMYYDRYVRRLPDTNKDTSSLFGSALHNALEYYYTKAPDVDAVKGRFQRYISVIYKRWMTQGFNIGHSTSYSDMMRLGIECLSTFPFGDITPNHCELDFTVPLDLEFDPDGIQIHGFIDVVGTYRGKDNVIIDYKSNKRKPTKKDLDSDYQFHLYAHAFYCLYGEYPHAVCRYDLRDHSVQFIDLTNHDTIMNEIRTVVNTIEQDDFSDLDDTTPICDRCPPWCKRKQY